MTTEIKMTSTIETVTYDGCSGVPEISGYGNIIDCTAQIDADNLVIKIGDLRFFPDQLEEFIADAKAFQVVAKTFYKKIAQ